jgi:D-glycero-D-manno-heptose 1,7-bisphosphate phosphatase
MCAGAPEALAELRRYGFSLVCVTNQPDIARGTISNDVVDDINARLVQTLPLDAIFVCRHDDADDCACRKPRPGLLLQAAAELGLDLDTSYLVGDRWRDIDAGAAAHCRTVLIDRGYDERASTMPADARVPSIAAAAAWIIADAALQK